MSVATTLLCSNVLLLSHLAYPSRPGGGNERCGGGFGGGGGGGGCGTAKTSGLGGSSSGSSGGGFGGESGGGGRQPKAQAQQQRQWQASGRQIIMQLQTLGGFTLPVQGGGGYSAPRQVGSVNVNVQLPPGYAGSTVWLHRTGDSTRSTGGAPAPPIGVYGRGTGTSDGRTAR